MKYICNGCVNENPCILEVFDNAEPPVTCPWRGNLFLSDDEPDDANWQELKEEDDMKKETEKERVDRRMAGFEHHGVCAGCAGQCDGCKDAANFKAGDPQRGKILMRALDIINGERQDQYGNPEDSFALIGKYWTEFLKANCAIIEGVQISPKEVAEMMALFKIARMSGQKAKRDNYLDCVGYLALAADMVEEA